MNTSSDVLLIIASLHGGYNGDVPGCEIGVVTTSPTTATYTLTRVYNIDPLTQSWTEIPVEDRVVSTFEVVVTPVAAPAAPVAE